MTTYNGAIKAASLLTGGASPQSGVGSWQAQGYIWGVVRVMVDYYAAAGTELSGSVIQMFPLLNPSSTYSSGGISSTSGGFMVLGFLLTVVASTGSLTGSIGDLNSATRYVSASSNFATAGSYVIGNAVTSTGPYVIGTNVTSATNTDEQIIITTGGATLGASNVFSLVLLYTIGG